MTSKVSSDDKTILIFYINVDGLSPQKSQQYIYDIMKDYNCNSDIVHYFLPVRNQETKVECVNPKLITDSEFQEIKDRLDKYNENLKIVERY